MQLDELPLAILREQVARLAAAFGGKPQTEQGAYLVELQRATRGWSRSELQEAISRAIDEEPHFPRIKAIRLHRSAAAERTEQPFDPNICQICHRHNYYAGFEFPSGAVVGRLRCDCPSLSGGWHTPAAERYVETDRAMIAAGFGTPPRREDYSA